MKNKTVSLIVLILFAFSAPATAATVTINHGGTQLNGTLSSLNIDGNGNVTVNVGGGTNLCGSSGSGTTCTNTAPTITVSNPPSSATVGTQVTASFSANANDSGQTATVTANYGSISGSTWSWTPSSSGTNDITLTVNDSQNCSNTASYSWSVHVNSSSSGGGSTGSATNIGGPYPNFYNASIGSGNAGNYYFTLTSSASRVIVYMTTTDWGTDLDLMVSNQSQPQCSTLNSSSFSNGTNGLWFAPIIGSSNETLRLVDSMSAGAEVKVTVCNRSNTSGGVMLYWVSY